MDCHSHLVLQLLKSFPWLNHYIFIILYLPNTQVSVSIQIVFYLGFLPTRLTCDIKKSWICCWRVIESSIPLHNYQLIVHNQTSVEVLSGGLVHVWCVLTWHSGGGAVTLRYMWLRQSWWLVFRQFDDAARVRSTDLQKGWSIRSCGGRIAENGH